MAVSAGEKYGKLKVIRKIGSTKNGHALWQCFCDCGSLTNVIATNLVSGRTNSCGCVLPNFRHGHYRYPEYNSWASMIQRCTNSNQLRFNDYGGRGIRVCDEWKTFENFLRDMGPRPEGMTLDRINVNGNYEPGNCKWATISEQNKNQRRYQNQDEDCPF